MENALYISVVGTLIMILLTIIGWFLNRIAKQYDEAQSTHNEQFDKLLTKFDVLTEIIYDHKKDVEVIKEQINTHSRELNGVNILFDRVRIVESDIAVLKDRTH